MTEPIRITRATTLKSKPKDGDLGFGQIFTDHMFVADFQDEKGWYDPRIEPYGPLAARPGGGGAALLPGHLRRAQGLPRRRRQGAAVPPAEARGAADQLGQAHVHPAARPRPRPPIIIQLVGMEREWVPKTVGTSLYVRPTIIASEAFLGVRPAKSYIYFVILSPVGAYYPEGMAPVKIRVEEKYVRAVDGGLGGVRRGRTTRRA